MHKISGVVDSIKTMFNTFSKNTCSSTVYYKCNKLITITQHKCKQNTQCMSADDIVEEYYMYTGTSVYINMQHCTLASKFANMRQTRMVEVIHVH